MLASSLQVLLVKFHHVRNAQALLIYLGNEIALVSLDGMELGLYRNEMQRTEPF